jgi:hypothetical protein
LEFEFKILSCRENLEWNSLLSLIPDENKSPHFTPEYYDLFEQRGEGKGFCFAGIEDDKVILYPTLINCINDLGYDLDMNCYDLQGAYGYNGPICNSDDPAFPNKFSKELLSYYHSNNIIAEFIRFCPIIQNHHYLDYIQAIYALDNVIIDLSGGLDFVWENSFDRGVRKAIRKSLKSDLQYQMFDGQNMNAEIIEAFLGIYNHTMARNNADEYYRFSNKFIAGLFDKMPENCLIAIVRLENDIISAELVLYNKSNAYGFLGGTRSNFYQVSPNSFLRYELIKSLIERGVQKYSIGGGKSKDDSVYLYKKSFSRYLDSRFYFGKKVHNDEIYKNVVKQWEERYPEKIEKYKNMVLKYRY